MVLVVWSDIQKTSLLKDTKDQFENSFIVFLEVSEEILMLREIETGFSHYESLPLGLLFNLRRGCFRFDWGAEHVSF